MRRALLLAVLAAPAIAAAQTVSPGSIIFAENGGTDYVHGPYVNADECNGASGAQVWLTWRIQAASLPAGSTYQVYASSQPHPTTGCTTQGNTTANPPLYAGAIGGPVIATTLTQTQAYQTSLFPAAINLACTTTADTVIHVCVQLTSGTTVVGFAKGDMTLSITPPDPPTGVGASPDDSAIVVSWSEPARAYDYLVRAQSLADKTGVDLTTPDPADPSPHLARTAAHATSFRMGGLVNGVTYHVNVAAFTQANTQGAWSSDTPPVLATPEPVADFWGRYKQLGGQDSGGCGTGAAGPVALLGAAALLRALRRRA